MDIQKERSIFDAWHYQDWRSNISANINENEYLEWYQRIYSHFAAQQERELQFKTWLAAKVQAIPEGFVLARRVVTLTCSELLEAFHFGAPDGEGDEDQMATEITVEWSEDGHSGKGYYAYYTELPEEGAIKLGENKKAMIEAAEDEGL